MARPGKSIAKQSEDRAGEKHLPVGGPGEKIARCGRPSSPPSREKIEERWSFDVRSKGQATQPSLGSLLRFEIQGGCSGGLDVRPAVSTKPGKDQGLRET